MRLINLGSGPDGIARWENYDWGVLPLAGKIGLVNMLVKWGIIDKRYKRNWPEIKFADVRKELPIESGVADWVYCSHVIEHLEKYDALALLVEIKRILRNEGKVRIVLPDLNKIIEKYGNDPDQFNRVYFGFEKDKKGGILTRFIRPHNWMYSYESFKKLMVEAGFEKIEKSNWQKGKMPDVKKLDLEIHKDLSFYIEAEK